MLRKVACELHVVRTDMLILFSKIIFLYIEKLIVKANCVSVLIFRL